jgi:hypothetical protein
MTPASLAAPLPVDPPVRASQPAQKPPVNLPWRLLATAVLIFLYYWQRLVILDLLGRAVNSLTGLTAQPNEIGVWVVTVLIVALVLIWRQVLARDKRFHAPLLVTAVLIMGDAAFSILENHPSQWLSELTGGTISSFSPTFIAILTTTLTELVLGRFFHGKWPHLASAYVSGISAGILVKSPALWPFVLCGMISITSKYVFRVGDRHIWNPTNFGMTMMLFLAPQTVASLSVQAGNEVWAVAVIWFMGGLILYTLGRLYIPVAFLLAFIPLSLMRSWFTGNSALTELAPVTSPMFQLYIFFMITDPKTTTKSRRSQIVVAICVAIMETFYRLAFRDIHSLYHALFTVGPIANVIEIVYQQRKHTAGRVAIID